MPGALLLLLLTAAVLCVLAMPLGQRVGPRAGWVLAAALVALTGAVLAIWSGSSGTRVESYAWLPSLDVSLRLRLDGLGLLFSLVVLGVGALVMAYSVHYLPPGRHGVFYALLTFFAAAMLALVLADDLVVLWVAWELTTVCSFLLIQQSGPRGRDPAVRTLIVTGAGGLALLAAVVLTVTTTGTTVLSDALASPVWSERPGTTAVVAALVAVAAFTKSAQVPFHGWLPDAMVASTPVSAYLHAAAMVKAGIYLLVRFSTAFHDVPAWNAMLVSVGLLTAVTGALFALQCVDLKALLAYSTVSQLGLLVATIGIGTGYAVVGALVHVLAHAVFKSALFMGVGLVDHEARTRDLRELSGLGRAMPATGVVMVLAAASMAGLPPLAGFVSKEALFKAMAGAPWGTALTVTVCLVAVLASTLTVAYSARMLRPFLGPPMPDPPREAPTAMVAPVLLAALTVGVVGLAGPALHPLVDSAAGVVRPDAPKADMSLWHGLNPALGMSVTVILLGGLLVLARHRVDRLVVGRRLTPVQAVDLVEHVRSGSVLIGARVGDLTRSDAPFRHLAAPLVALTAVLVAFLARAGLPSVPAGVSRPLDWLLLGLVSVGVALTLAARSRVALVTTVGIVGFTVAMGFFNLGAPDVALTQLLVEILTVVVMVLLLVRLPRGFHASPRQRTWTAAILAVVAGATATGLAMVVLANPDASPVSDHYLARAYELTGGENVVNTILVDFRALDTLGEMVVLGMAAVSVLVALDARGVLPRHSSPTVVPSASPVLDPWANTLALRVVDRLIGPILLVLSAWFFLRGHYHPGGGFIGALVGGAALALIFLAAADDHVARLRIPYRGLVGSGVVIAVTTGLAGYADGSFLRPLYLEVAGVQLSTGMLFDVGVYLTVLGLIMATLARLGIEGRDPTPLRMPRGVTAERRRG